MASVPRVLEALKGQSLLDSSDEIHDAIQALYNQAKACLDTHEQQQDTTTAGAEHLEGKEVEVTAALVFLSRCLLQQQRGLNGKISSNFGLPLSMIVSSAGTNVFDFFRELPIVSSKLAPFLESHGTSPQAIEVQASTVEWQKTMLMLMLLAKKYKELFSTYMRTLEQYKQVVLRLGWVLFLVLKPRLLPRFPDLVSCMELLVCCINVLVSHLLRVPEEVLSHSKPGPCPASSDASDVTAASAGSAAVQPQSRPPVDTLQTIACSHRADCLRVTSLMTSVDTVLKQLLPNYVPEWRSTSGEHPAGAKVATHCTHFPGLVADLDRLNVCVAGLEREYVSAVLRTGTSELDERDFLFLDFSRFASPRMSPRTAYGTGMGHMHATAFGSAPAGPMHMSPVTATPTQLQGAAQRLGPGAFCTGPTRAQPHQPLLALSGGHLPHGLQSPMPMMAMHMAQGAHAAAAATPITEAMSASAWLRGITSSLPSHASPALQRMFAACDAGDPGPTICARAHEMVAAALPQEQPTAPSPFPLLQPQLNMERRSEALKLYYHVLEAVLGSESAAMNAHYGAGSAAARAALSNLLTSAKFHTGLMACCLEVVVTSYKMVSCTFPWVLGKLKLKAFDLSKMLQPFVRQLPSLPSELKRHLFQVEEKVVESLAWESGSSLYPLLVAVAEAQQASRASSTTTSNTSAAGSQSGNNTLTAGTAAAAQAQAAAQQQQQQHGDDQHMDDAGLSPCKAGQGQQAIAPGGAHRCAPSPSKRSHSSFSSMMSPLKKARGEAAPITTQPAAITDPLPIAVGRPPPPHLLMQGGAGAALGVLHDFLRKVLKLAWVRVAWLCQSFDLAPLEPSEVHQKVYETVEHAVYFHTNLFYNRHVDQIILSALYGFCKVHKLAGVSFKEIITQYRRQPQAVQAVFRACVLTQSSPGLVVGSRGDIIAFYNVAFVPVMKQFLLKGEAAGHPAHGLPPVAPPAHLRASPGKRHIVHVQHHPGGSSSHTGGAAASSPTPPSPRGVGGGGAALASPPGGRAGIIGLCGAAGSAGAARGGSGPADAGDGCVHHAVNAALKQTISGFFPTIGRSASPTNGAVGIAAKFLPPTALAQAPGVPPPAPRAKPSPISVPTGGLSALGMPPKAPSPLPPPRARRSGSGTGDRMPSGIATLLRALDSTQDAGPQVQAAPAPCALPNAQTVGASRVSWGLPGSLGGAATPGTGAAASPVPRPESPGFTFAVIRSAAEVGANVGTPPLGPAAPASTPQATKPEGTPVPATTPVPFGLRSAGSGGLETSPPCENPSPAAWLAQAAAAVGGAAGDSPHSPNASNASSTVRHQLLAGAQGAGNGGVMQVDV